MARLGGMNARDIRVLLRGNIDPALGKVLVGLAERQDHLFQLLGQLAQNMDSMANSLLAQGGAVASLQGAHDRIKQARSGGISVQSELTGEADDDARG